MVKKIVKKKYDSGIFIPAGLLLGIGVGMLTNQVAPFTLIGLALGFIFMYLFKKK